MIEERSPTVVTEYREKLKNKIEAISEDLEVRSEEHTSELQSHSELVCRLLLEKKKCQPYLS